ncbi:MAG: hypothetical protein RQ856_05830 [Candidatus Izemoplasmatales bacterium]|nr:hypothetical protein [Candidatus Izemoplasmatales bacterium]
MVYLIKPNRLAKELSAHAKGQARGVLNWYINSEDGLMYVYYDYANVCYCCIVSNRDELPIGVRSFLGEDNEILGIYEKEEKEDELDYSVFPSDIESGY